MKWITLGFVVGTWFFVIGIDLRVKDIAADIKVIRSTSTNTGQHAITADTVDVDNRR
jgi:hypothetical protein